jgi:geranylgeranyl diphosphate synthase type II
MSTKAISEHKTSERIETELDRVSQELLNGVPERLRESVRYSLLGGGKRIRPRLAYAVGSTLGSSEEVSLRLGCALEMIHAYTLIHDDLPAMDDDDLRRGQPTNHRVYGEAMAILAGDSLALLAFDALLPLREKLSSDQVLSLIETLLEAGGARGVIAGQAAEFSPPQEGRDIDSLCETFRLKTGALFRATLLLPWIASPHHSNRALGEALAKLGDTLGIVFQIADDLEDSFEEKSSDPNHIARFLSKPEASRFAISMLDSALDALNSIDAGTAQSLTPFIAELRKKAEVS